MRHGVRVFGGVRLNLDGSPVHLTESEKRVLSILVAAGPAGLGAGDECVEAYLETGTRSRSPASLESARASTRVAVGRLRSKFPAILTHSRRYQIDLEPSAVDAWDLLQTPPAVLATDMERVAELLSGAPFAGIEPSPLIGAVTERAIAARSQLIKHLAGVPLDRPMLAVVRETIERELLVSSSDVALGARLHLDHGLGGDAVALIDRHDEELRSLGFSGISTEVAQLRAEVLAAPTDDVPEVEPAAPPVAFAEQLPAFLRNELVGRTVGRDALIGELQEMASASGGGGVVLSGPTGAGKTRMLAKAAEAAVASGNRLVTISGATADGKPLDAFFAAFPFLRDELEALRNGEHEHDALDGVALDLLAALEREAGEGACLIVDDAQWLDGRSRWLLEKMALSWVGRRWRIFVAGRADREGPGWERFGSTLTRSGFRSYSLGVLDQDELVELVGAHHPRSTNLQRFHVANRLMHLGAATPGLARRRLQVQTITQILTSPLPATPELGSGWPVDVTAIAREVAGVASMLGLRFSIGDVIAVSVHSEQEVLVSLDELVEAGHIRETDEPQVMAFVHDLARVAFRGQLRLGERRGVAERAITVVRDDIQRARLLVEALPLVPAPVVIEALEASARQALGAGSPDVAVELFDRAKALRQTPASPRVLLAHATATQRTGIDSGTLRVDAFRGFIDAGCSDGALEAATADEMEFEALDPDPDRITMLEELASVGLGPSQEFRRRRSLARHLAMAGRHDEARAHFEAAEGLAGTADERFSAWNSAWPTICRLHPKDWSFPDMEAADLVTATQRDRFHQTNAIRLLCLGQTADAGAHLAAIATEKNPGVAPYQQWHNVLIKSGVAFVGGEWVAASGMADEAFQFAQRHGIRNASAVRGAQLFMEMWLRRDYEMLAMILGSLPPDAIDSSLARAGFGAVLTRSDETKEQGRELALDALAAEHEAASPTSRWVAAIASFAADQATSELNRIIEAELRALDGTALVVGAGFMHLGPVSHYLANVAADPDLQRLLLRQAIDEADGWGLPVWQVALRRELAERGGDPSLIDEARHIAAGSQLEAQLFAA